MTPNPPEWRRTYNHTGATPGEPVDFNGDGIYDLGTRQLLEIRASHDYWDTELVTIYARARTNYY